MEIFGGRKFNRWLQVLFAVVLVGFVFSLEGQAEPPVLCVAEWPLQLVYNTDGIAPFSTMSASLCVRTVTEAKSGYLYFDVDDDFLSSSEVGCFLDRTDARAYIRVEYYSTGRTDDFLAVEYDSMRGSYESTVRHRKPQRPGWYQHVFTLFNPQFSNRQNKRADFRITNCGDGDEFVRKVQFFLDPQKAKVPRSVLKVTKIEWGNGYSGPVVRFFAENVSSKPQDCVVKVLGKKDLQAENVGFHQQLHLSGNGRKPVSIEARKFDSGIYLFTLEIVAADPDELLCRACCKLTVPPRLKIILDQPRYRSGLYASSKSKRISGHVEVRSDVPAQEVLELSFEKQDGTVLSLCSLKRPSYWSSFEFDNLLLSEDEYLIHACLLDGRGSEVVRAVEKVRVIGPGVVETCVRSDNVLLVNERRQTIS